MPRTPCKPTRASLTDRPDVSVYFDRTKKLWRAEIRLRQDPHTGRYQVKKVSSKNKNTLYDKLSTVLEELDQGVDSPARYTVADCVAEFLRDQITDLDPNTQDNYTRLAFTHITPYLGRYLLAELRAADVLAWLRGRREHLSSRTLRLVLNLLERAIRYAQIQEMVARNVAELARFDQRDRLKGDEPGRPSKSMTLEQAVAVLRTAKSTRWYAYLVLSIVIGARTEEIRALTWDQVDTGGNVPTIHV
ncbi:phage integrase central domain-containing protein [Nocardiopsis sp. NPDC050513]|uniref:phage integrase central domain-containing protein n=1 Tax=Nocardiopsis sp. NPDC050513 TaxID=3364338 RepID=UPI0037980915